MKKIMLAAAAVVLLSPAPLYALANHETHECHTQKGCHTGHHEPCMDHKKAFEDAVGLTPDQRQKSAAIWENTEAEIKPLKEQHMAKQKELMMYLGTQAASESGAMAKQQEINALDAQIDAAKLHGVFSVKALMTPAQQQKATDFMAKQKAEHENWHKEHHGDKHSHHGHQSDMTPPPEGDDQ